MREKNIGQAKIKLIKADITNQSTDAVVNAANTRLAPGGGVAGAIHRAAGPKLWEECKTRNGCNTGEAKITKGYNLPAKFVIHTVGPVYSGTKEDETQLISCYNNSLNLAEKHHLKSISFPAISTGAFGYPLKKAACVALQATTSWLKEKKSSIIVQFVLYSDHSLRIFEEVFDTELS
ncbi:MAG: O-acetyl-ADP-ribose deacetylase [Candidatus Thermoplasmatota archaeon]|nr:O-acetyl-ADP-ribose deacetylase [Candidatus Thermoplasmatota archaeon]